MPEVAKKLKTVYKADGAEYAVLRPNPKVVAEGQKVYNRAFKEAVDADALIRPKLDAIMRKQDLWDEDKQSRHDQLQADVAEYEKCLLRGYQRDGDGKKLGLKLSEGRALAIKIRQLRHERSQLLSERNRLDGMTAEAQADNTRFNYFVSASIVHNDGPNEGKRVYKDVEDYLEHADEDRAYQGATKLMNMLVGDDDPEWARKMPENKFLSRYGFVDEKLRLINKEGKLIDVEGRLINEDGRYINEKGQFVNSKGERIDKDGEYIFEDAQPFLDEEGKPLTDGPKGPVACLLETAKPKVDSKESEF